MTLVKFALRVVLLIFACVTAAVAAPFQNGSFEIGTDPGGAFLTFPNGDNTDITGWTVILGDIDYIGGYWQAAQGLRSLDLIGDQFVGGVQQTFDTIPGGAYSVSFAMAGNPAGGPTIRPLAVTVAGTTNNFTFDITGATLSNMNWTPHQFTFVATGTSETIQFVSDLSADPAGCCYGAALDNVQITPLPDLTIAKSHGGNFTQGQVGATYTLTVTNSGVGPTAGTVTVTDTLPVGLTATAISGTGWGCVLGTLTCTRSDALGAGASYPDITLTVTVANNAPASVTNTSTVAGGGEINSGNDTATDPTTIIQVADLTIAKAHVGNFTQGQVGATYTITVTNSGAGPTVGTVTVTDTLPGGLTATAISGTGWGCVLGTLTCTRSDALGAGASYPAITLTVTVANNAPASVINTVTVSGGGEINTGNDTATDPTTITQVADLTIAKSHSGNFTQGQVGATYTLTVTNSGVGPTVGTVTVTDTLPVGLTATAISGTGWGCVLGTLTCTRSDVLGAGASYPLITLTVTVAGNAPASVINAATVAGGGEINTGNDTATDPTTVIQIAALTIAKSHVGNFTQGQVGATYALTVINGGPGPTVGTVTVTDTLPSGLTATAISGAGWSCVLGTLTCARSDALGTGLSYPDITLTVTVANNAPPSVTNTATVSGGGAPGSSANDPTTIIQVADLTIAKSHSGNFTQGQVGATYTITVTNSGAGPTVGTVTVTDTLPAALTATAVSGSGWSCVLGTLTCTRSDALGAGANYPAITLTVTVAGNAPASVTNTATVAGGGEINTGNDTANDPTTITQIAGLALTKSHSGSFTQGQVGATYALTLTNTGVGPTVGTVTVTDTLPAGLTATAISGTGWSCVLGTLTCTRSDALGASLSYPVITLTVTVSNSAPASVVNTAVATGGGAPPAPSNTATDATQIIGAGPAAPATIPTLQESMLALLALSLLAAAGWILRTRRA